MFWNLLYFCKSRSRLGEYTPNDKHETQDKSSPKNRKRDEKYLTKIQENFGNLEKSDDQKCKTEDETFQYKNILSGLFSFK